MSFAQTVFRPASAVMNRLSFAKKIAVIGVLFLVPIAGVTTLLFRKYGAEVESARRERTGVDMVRPIRDVLKQLTFHRDAHRQFLVDHSDAALTELGVKIDFSFARLDALDKDYGVEFATRESYLKIKSDWLTLKQSIRSLSAVDAYKAHDLVIDGLGTFAATAADGSGLSLDPDLDSYYLMDAAVFRVPGLVENLADLRRFAVDAAESGKLSAEDKTSMVVLERLLSMDDANVTGDLGKVYAYRPAMKAQLGPTQEKAFAAMRHFRTTVTTQLLVPGQPKVDPRDLQADALRATEEVFVLAEQSLGGLDEVLVARIHGAVSARNEIVAGLAFVLAAVAYLYFGFLKGVRSSLAAIKAGAARLAQGNLDIPVDLATRDELGEIGDSVNQVMRQVQAFAAAQIEMSRQHDLGATSHRLDSAQFPGAFGSLATKLNELVGSHLALNQRVVELVREYSRGNLSAEMAELPGEKAAITAAINGVKHQLLSINSEIQGLVTAAAHGNFEARGNAGAFEFSFREMVAGLNRLMDTCQSGLDDVSTMMGQLAGGDLTARMTGAYEGAFDRIRTDCNSTAQQLTTIVGEIRESTEAINMAAQEISMGNADLAERTEQQASSLQETAASMEELTSTVKANNESASQANQLAETASQVAVKGGTAVGEVVGVMREIADSSSKIVDIISVIDGIAFQTNLLALNAAVEAARAGEQGRGFAVVASEVRGLAQRTAAAAKEIKVLIGASAERVDTGSKLVANAGATMEEIVRSVRRVAAIMSEITSASAEQSSGIEQVNTAVMQMDKVTHQNAALVEEAAAAAKSMEEQANALSASVAVFRTEAQVVAAPVVAPRPQVSVPTLPAPRARAPERRAHS